MIEMTPREFGPSRGVLAEYSRTTIVAQQAVSSRVNRFATRIVKPAWKLVAQVYGYSQGAESLVALAASLLVQADHASGCMQAPAHRKIAGGAANCARTDQAESDTRMESAQSEGVRCHTTVTFGWYTPKLDSNRG